MVTFNRTLFPNAISPSGNAPVEGRRHTVRRGDTLYGLAREHGLRLDELVRANPQIRDPSHIEVGQELTIPAASAAAPPALSPDRADRLAPTPTDPATVRQARQRALSANWAARARVEGLAAPEQAPVGVGAVPRRSLEAKRTLRRGARGEDVRDLQEQLKARGANLVTDGVFGRGTEQAVRDFQGQQGIAIDGVVGPNTRAAFARSAEGSPNAGQTGPVSGPDVTLRSGASGPDVEQLQERLNRLSGAGLRVDGDFGPRTRRAVESFQERAGLEPDGDVGPLTRRALDEVEAGTRQLAEPSTPTIGPGWTSGPNSRTLSADGNEFTVHNVPRQEFGGRSVPGNRIIALDANSASGREEVLRPLIVIPDNATPLERRQAQAAADRVAQWFDDNLPGQRHSTGRVRTTSQNGRGLRGVFHTEFHSVNDSAAVNLIKQRPEEYAQIMAETLGQIPGANFIVPHGDMTRWGIRDPGAVGRDGTSEVSLARHVIEEGFFRLGGEPSI